VTRLVGAVYLVRTRCLRARRADRDESTRRYGWQAEPVTIEIVDGELQTSTLVHFAIPRAPRGTT